MSNYDLEALKSERTGIVPLPVQLKMSLFRVYVNTRPTMQVFLVWKEETENMDGSQLRSWVAFC